MTTKSARPSVPPSSQLKREVDSLKSDLKGYLDQLDLASISDDIHASENVELLIKQKWHDYGRLHRKFCAALTAEGVADEVNQEDSQFEVLRTQKNNLLKSLRKMTGVDAGSISSKSSTALSGSSEQRKLHLATKIKRAKEKISKLDRSAEIERKLKALDIQAQKAKLENEEKIMNEKQELLLMKEKLKVEDEIEELEDQLSEASGSVITKASRKSRRVQDWIDNNVAVQSYSQSIPAQSTAGRNRSLNPLAAAFEPLATVGEFVTPGAKQTIDASTRFLAIEELKRTPSKPFNGEPHLYNIWIQSLNHRMKPLGLAAIDKIDILLANTTGDPQNVVLTFKSAYGSDPDAALAVIFDKLQKRFGAGIEIANSLRKRLLAFPEIRGTQSDPKVAAKLRELSDLCIIVNSNMSSVPDLKTFDQASGLEPVRQKLPDFLNNRWRNVKSNHSGSSGFHPSFDVFCNFLENQAEILCNDLFTSGQIPRSRISNQPQKSHVLQTNLTENECEVKFSCPLHKAYNHDITECNTFANLDFKMRRLLIGSYNLCFRCLGSHLAVNCNKIIHCDVCKASNHITLMHKYERNSDVKQERPVSKKKSFIRSNTVANNSSIDSTRVFKDSKKILPDCSNSSLCTSVCQSAFGRSCGKTLLVEISVPSHSRDVIRVYAIVDEQSTNTFATASVFDSLKLDSATHDYRISTLTSQRTNVRGRITRDLVVRGVNCSQSYSLPLVYENDFLPDTRHEVATPEMLRRHSQLREYADNFVPLENAQVAILIGRDAAHLMATEQVTSTPPFVQRTPLGWAVIGSICPYNSDSHNTEMSSYRTNLYHEHYEAQLSFPKSVSSNVFLQSSDDESQGISQNDRKFINIITNNINVNSDGYLETPLPLRNPDKIMPDNCVKVLYRQKSTLSRMKQDPDKLAECLIAMQKFIDNKHVERVPKSEITRTDGKVWYLPVFPVIHPKKLKIRLVFDSAASYDKTSLNSSLLQGPDQNNTLRGVLLRFRENKIGFVADVESMFHSFYVIPQHRDFMRFFWFADNNPNSEVVHFRARVHIFGNTSSPAVATFALRETAQFPSTSDPIEAYLNRRADTYIRRHFYVDDGLGCAKNVHEAVQILSRAKNALSRYHVHLHKIVSSDPEVMNAFPKSDRAHDITSLDFNDALTHRTLGVSWSVESDSFVITNNIPERPFTKRGILAVVNSVFDPMGLVSPVVLEGRLIQRAIIPRRNETENSNLGWDDPLPPKLCQRWLEWKNSLSKLGTISLPRCLFPKNFGDVKSQSIHVFSDASSHAIGHVVYMRSIDDEHKIHISFLYGESKVAPISASSIPRLELCAAVDATLSARRIYDELIRKPETIEFYTDSKVVLAYLANEERRFARYVSRRIDIIRTSSHIHQWHYVTSKENPADIATRPIGPEQLATSIWLTGPTLLWDEVVVCGSCELSEAPLPEEEAEQASVCKTSLKMDFSSVFTDLFKKIEKWSTIVNIAKYVIKFIRKLSLRGQKSSVRPFLEETCQMEASQELIRAIQSSSFAPTIDALHKGRGLPASDVLFDLNPFLDAQKIIRVGGRLKNANFPFGEKHPIVLPTQHPATVKILAHYHEKSGHQGRHVTLGAVRSAGYHIINARKLIRKYLTSCIECRKLRASPPQQIMADLPPDRLDPTPAFTNVGTDVMGPWLISQGTTTRRTNPQRKSWAAVFTCLASRAVHVEPLPSLDTPTFCCALRRFISIRGECKLMRSDRGTNFTGLNQELDLKTLENTANSMGFTWEFNPPHASHFGGVWERKIGQIRRAMDVAMKKISPHKLTYDEFHTLLLEAAAIVNATPLWCVSDDPNDPQPISPSMLLTLKGTSSSLTGSYNDSDLVAYGTRRWRKVQGLAEEFWKHWRVSYLQSLQRRRKWKQKQRSVVVNDVVLLRDKKLKRNHWPLGLIVDVKKSNDGLVRSVIVKTIRTVGSNATPFYYERPIAEIVVLSEAKQDR